MRADHHTERLIREAGLGRWQRDAVGDHLRVGGGHALAQLLGQELGDADAAAAVGFWGEGFGDAPVIGVVGMHGEDPGQALAAGVGGGDVVRVQALGQEQIGLHLVEELEMSRVRVCTASCILLFLSSISKKQTESF